MAKPRTAAEVARRVLLLNAVCGAAFHLPDRRQIVEWLDENGLRDDLSPTERAFVEAKRPAKKDVIRFTWHSERLVVLVWALGLIDALPAADVQSKGSSFQDLLPPFADVSVTDFVRGAKLRPLASLKKMEERLMHLHWCARDATLNARPPREPVDGEIIQERHHAINWIVNFEGEEWDDVTTGT